MKILREGLPDLRSAAVSWRPRFCNLIFVPVHHLVHSDVPATPHAVRDVQAVFDVCRPGLVAGFHEVVGSVALSAELDDPLQVSLVEVSQAVPFRDLAVVICFSKSWSDSNPRQT